MPELIPSIEAEEAAFLDSQLHEGLTTATAAAVKLYRTLGWAHLTVMQGPREGEQYVSWGEYIRDRCDESRRQYLRKLGQAEEDRQRLMNTYSEATEVPEATEPVDPELIDALHTLPKATIELLRKAGAERARLEALKEALRLAHEAGEKLARRHIESALVGMVKPADLLYDICGVNEVPAHLEEVFWNAWLMQKVRREIHNLIEQVEELDEKPGGDFIPTITLRSFRKNWVLSVDSFAPYMICPVCKGNLELDCDACAGRGWLTRNESKPYRKAPDDSANRAEQGGETEGVAAGRPDESDAGAGA